MGLPKIRAWDMNDKRMSYGEIEYYDDSVMYRFDHFNVGSDFEVEFMQGTGLTDKKDNEIYAGDIVRMPWSVYDEPELFEVTTKPGHAPRIDNVTRGKELWLIHKDCEVVGNIWEDGDLIDSERTKTY